MSCFDEGTVLTRQMCGMRSRDMRPSCAINPKRQMSRNRVKVKVKPGKADSEDSSDESDKEHKKRNKNNKKGKSGEKSVSTDSE